MSYQKLLENWKPAEMLGDVECTRDSGVEHAIKV